MSPSSLRRWWRLDDRGSSALEFALVMPMMLTFMFSLIESYFAIFNFQQVQAIASETARCVALNSVLCNGSNGNPTAADFAVKYAAPGHSVDKLITSEVTSISGTTCGGQAGMTKVTIAYPISKAMPINVVPSFMNLTLTGIGCFPTITPP